MAIAAQKMQFKFNIYYKIGTKQRQPQIFRKWNELALERGKKL